MSSSLPHPSPLHVGVCRSQIDHLLGHALAVGLRNIRTTSVQLPPAGVFSCLVVAFKACRRPRSFGAKRTRFLASSLSCHRAFNSAFHSSVAHQLLGTCLRQIGGAMSVGFDRSVSASNEVMSLTLPALVSGIGEASLAAIAFWKFTRRFGSACVYT